MERTLVLKINSDLRGEELKNRAKGNWVVNPKNMMTVDYVVVMNRQKVIAEYTLGNTFTVNKQDRRVGNLILDETHLGLLNKTFDYATSNPATITTLEELKKRKN